MLSKNQIKFINSLYYKKYRKQNELFIVQGSKSIIELLSSDHVIHSLYITKNFINSYNIASDLTNIDYYIITEAQLTKISNLKSNNSGLAIVKIKSPQFNITNKDEWILMLNAISDPGNLGTIIRTADWFNIRKVILSENCADFYNPKVINATMGSFCRIIPQYKDLNIIINEQNKPVYGTFVEGKEIKKYKQPKPGFIIMGNESKGIDNDLAEKIDHKVAINGNGSAESLNVAVATGIILHHFTG